MIGLDVIATSWTEEYWRKALNLFIFQVSTGISDVQVEGKLEGLTPNMKAVPWKAIAGDSNGLLPLPSLHYYLKQLWLFSYGLPLILGPVFFLLPISLFTFQFEIRHSVQYS